jgi:hypothetical protein
MSHEERGRRYRDERERREKQDGITRRDFLDGTAITAAGLAIAATNPPLTGAQAMAKAAKDEASTPLPPSYYAPSFMNPNTGEPDAVIERTIKIDGSPITDPSQIHSAAGGPARDSQEGP